MAQCCMLKMTMMTMMTMTTIMMKVTTKIMTTTMSTTTKIWGTSPILTPDLLLQDWDSPRLATGVSLESHMLITNLYLASPTMAKVTRATEVMTSMAIKTPMKAKESSLIQTLR